MGIKESLILTRLNIKTSVIESQKFFVISPIITVDSIDNNRNNMNYIIRRKNMFGFLLRDKDKVIHVNDMDNLIGNVEIIDIREPYEYKMGTIRTAKSIPMGNLLSNPDKYLDKQQTYYILCQSGARSGRTTNLLSKQGYNVINVAGGFGAYVGTKRK